MGMGCEGDCESEVGRRTEFGVGVVRKRIGTKLIG